MADPNANSLFESGTIFEGISPTWSKRKVYPWYLKFKQSLQSSLLASWLHMLF